MSRALEVTVCELKPELLDDYLRFFDKEAFIDFPYWSGCYCGFYETSGDDWDASAEAGPAHRVAKADRIRTGKSRGLLAHADSKVVGWCNAQRRTDFTKHAPVLSGHRRSRRACWLHYVFPRGPRV